MSQGFLLFAHNNEKINYGAMAVWCAQRLKKYYDQPVSLVCDQNTLDSISMLDTSIFDHIISSEVETKQVKRYSSSLFTFKNLDRANAWELTPYDETVIIDTDIIIQSSVFNSLWGSNQDIIVCKDAKHIFDKRFKEFEYLGMYTAKFFWATQFYFKKNQESKIFFDTCKWVKENYSWHALCHDFDSRLMRNDYVWSLSLHMLGGSTNSEWCATMPWTLYYATDQDIIHSMDHNGGVVISTNNPVRLCSIKNKDIHYMNKLVLMEHVNKELGLTHD